MSDKNTPFYTKRTLNCGGQLLDLSTPKIMGILNVSSDSFYDGGRYNSKDTVLKQAEKMLHEGADIIDVGGLSSRPGAAMLSDDEEIKRVIPVIEWLKTRFDVINISVDTFRSKVAKQAVDAGAVIVNDISAGELDKKMLKTVAELQVPYVLMHMQGTPENMQLNPVYHAVVDDLIDFFSEKVIRLRHLGVNDIILDPGFGFGKTVQHNFQLLKNLSDFKIFDLPIMVGLSRKSMICKTLKVNPENALNGTTSLHTLALANGVTFLRVHDVKEAQEVIQLMHTYVDPENLVS